MTSICSSQERVAARSSHDVAAAPAGALFTISAIALGSGALVAAGLGRVLELGAGHGAGLATPAILALVSAATVAVSRSLPERGGVLSAAVALVAAAVIAALLGPNVEFAAIGRMLGGLGLGAIAAVAIVHAVSLVANPRSQTAGILGTGLGTGVLLGVSVGTVVASL